MHTNSTKRGFAPLRTVVIYMQRGQKVQIERSYSQLASILLLQIFKEAWWEQSSSPDRWLGIWRDRLRPQIKPTERKLSEETPSTVKTAAWREMLL